MTEVVIVGGGIAGAAMASPASLDRSRQCPKAGTPVWSTPSRDPPPSWLGRKGPGPPGGRRGYASHFMLLERQRLVVRARPALAGGASHSRATRRPHRPPRCGLNAPAQGTSTRRFRTPARWRDLACCFYTPTSQVARDRAGGRWRRSTRTIPSTPASSFSVPSAPSKGRVSRDVAANSGVRDSHLAPTPATTQQAL